MKQPAKEVGAFFDRYPTKVRDLALGVRALVGSVVPDARETLDLSAKIVGYGFGPRYADTICVIIPSQKEIKLGIARATELPDPKRLLKGSGKVHRHIVFAESSDLRQAGVKALLSSALAAWRKRSERNEDK